MTRAFPSTRPSSRPPNHRSEPVSISRPNFVALCHQLTAEDEQIFEHLWRSLGLSVDWSHTYATISERAQRVSQRGFLRLARRKQVVQRTAPTLWDVDFRTAVSQAELEDRERPGAYHRIRFPRVADDGAVDVETTRPELLPACVALVAHPDDERYGPLFGTEVSTPLFGVRVPVLAHGLADPDKGSGIAMICTFGDTTDVVWWRELSLADPHHRRARRPPPAGRVGGSGLGVRRPRGGRRRPTARWRDEPSNRPRPGSSSCWPPRAR